MDAKNLQIIEKNISGSDKRFLLKLNRNDGCLEIFEKADKDKVYTYHSIRKDFDISNYEMFEKIKSISCICGSSDTPTPYGIFNIQGKSKDFYISKYHKLYDEVKFIGYLVIFEDYFIHSNMYLIDADNEMIKSGKAEAISVDDKFTQGCIRISQDEINWLVENIDVGTIIIL